MISYFQLKPYVKCFSILFKSFKLKIMVVKPKAVQVVEPDEEPVNQFSSTDRNVQKPFLSFRMFVQLIKIEPQPVEVESQPVEVESQPVDEWLRGG